MKKYYLKHRPVRARQLTEEDLKDEGAYPAHEPGDYLITELAPQAPTGVLDKDFFEDRYVLAPEQEQGRDVYTRLQEDYMVRTGELFVGKIYEAETTHIMIVRILWNTLEVLEQNHYGSSPAYHTTYTPENFIDLLVMGKITRAPQQPLTGPRLIKR